MFRLSLEPALMYKHKTSGVAEKLSLFAGDGRRDECFEEKKSTCQLPVFLSSVVESQLQIRNHFPRIL